MTRLRSSRFAGHARPVSSRFAGQGGLARSLRQELRVMLAEWLLKRALLVMPEEAPEAVPMARALGAYADEVMHLNRWSCT
jgi:hypothetical protein